MHEKRNNTKKRTDDSFRKVNENSRILLEPSHTLSVLLRSFFFAYLSMGPTTSPGWPTDFAFLHNPIALRYIFFATTARITGFLGEKQSVLS